MLGIDYVDGRTMIALYLKGESTEKVAAGPDERWLKAEKCWRRGGLLGYGICVYPISQVPGIKL